VFLVYWDKLGGCVLQSQASPVSNDNNSSKYVLHVGSQLSMDIYSVYVLILSEIYIPIPKMSLLPVAPPQKCTLQWKEWSSSCWYFKQ